jgi:hypothetical protein
VISSDKISVVSNFFAFPGGRFEKNGPGSGEAFRETVLVPALKNAMQHGHRLIVNLDGVLGYPASFLDEAFGGLIRYAGFSNAEVNQYLVVEALSPHLSVYVDLANQFMSEAKFTPANRVAS